MSELTRPKTHDPRPGMGRPHEMWKYRLAQRVRGIRLLQNGGEGWSVRHFAIVCGISPSTMLRLEAGDGADTAMIVKISQTTGVSSDWLLGLDRVPRRQHEIVDQAYEMICSLASSLDYSVNNPEEMTIRNLRNTVEMIARSRQRLVDLAFRLRYPDPNNLKLSVPYGYEFVQRVNERLGYDIDV